MTTVNGSSAVHRLEHTAGIHNLAHALECQRICATDQLIPGEPKSDSR
ncbi:hypothetical protein PF008_g106 [Phytophthora fragariae]|uniref:Uncharacterized protein n=1 Tax=Phytophthora fragariae TaxID=53985 RepID=A0A6G0SNW1_9STRA|nr:hypothetical protein PF003_g26381 [Phytophthora fragariae]KAE9362384.1 hypothetical protein PF008_g106 [Phytophthora fragariae]